MRKPARAMRCAARRFECERAAWTLAGGSRSTYSTDELLGILASEPERVSPSALLRPVFQDQILPTSAYIGGPAEIAYFAQSAVLYERILGQADAGAAAAFCHAG
jgi:uncharacterized protein YllA (UPF0747 family)